MRLGRPGPGGEAARRGPALAGHGGGGSARLAVQPGAPRCRRPASRDCARRRDRCPTRRPTRPARPAISTTTASRSSSLVEGREVGGEPLRQHGEDLRRPCRPTWCCARMVVDGRARRHAARRRRPPRPGPSARRRAAPRPPVSWSRSRESSLSMEHPRARAGRARSRPPRPRGQRARAPPPARPARSPAAGRARPSRVARSRAAPRVPSVAGSPGNHATAPGTGEARARVPGPP